MRRRRTPATTRHHSGREARAHWLLLLLGVLVFLGGLCFNGYVRQVGADGGGPRPRVAAVPTGVPEQLPTGGPVLRIAADGSVQSRTMPHQTIALTFDDGPDPEWTPKVLELLARHEAHATFFVIGSKVNDHPALVRRMIAEGHEVGAHTFTHPELATVAQWRRQLELTLSSNAIAGATGMRPFLFRPPYGSEPDAVTSADYAALRDAARAGFLVVLADHDTEDWRRSGVESILERATPEGTGGAVVMMHDSGGDRAQTLTALDALLGRLAQRGYRFTTVSEGLGLPPPEPATDGMRRRGEALRWAQLGSNWLADGMLVLLAVALSLAGLRLLVQLVTARIHVRRVRRQRRQLRYLGPVSVIVPAYNEAANIAATVLSLLDNDYPIIEVIVVDDGSTDGTGEIVARMGLPNVRVVRQPNGGKPAALNHGIARARHDLLVLVDGDTVFEPTAIGRLVQPFVDSDVGAVSGNTKVANRWRLLGRWQHLEYVIGFNLDRRMFDVAQCLPTVPGAIGAFRRAAMHDVRGVSAATLAEDTDLTMAITRAGWRVVYVEDAISWTEAPSTLRQLWRQRYRWCYGTMQAMWKHRRALMEHGPAGKLGRRGLAYLLLFQIMLPLTAPMVDAYALYGVLFLPRTQVAAVWGGFLAAQAVTAGYALRLDGERLGVLWALPLQQVVYRQLMYLVVIQSTVTALVGSRLRWQRVARTGEASTVYAGR